MCSKRNEYNSEVTPVVEMAPSGEISHYELLGVAKNASQEEIKRAYRQALLRHHPDKRKEGQSSMSIDTLVAAFKVLSDPILRREYDWNNEKCNYRQSHKSGPRPAHVVSLDELVESDIEGTITWTYPCRCGGVFVLNEGLLEQDVHFISCDACSEALWVGYEALED